ncbi:MAG: hypothetical protein WAO58_11325 [Fimbriimonadaceae bacterium]
MLKRILSIVMVMSVLGLVMGGCGKAEEEKAAEPAPAPTTGT